MKYDKNDVSIDICNKRDHILVHVHLFYLDMWQEIKNCLENLNKLKKNWDLYITLVDTLYHEKINSIEREIKHFKSDVKILRVSNKGYDIGPFIEVLNHTNLDEYDLIIKLHSKRNVNPLTKLGTFYDVSGAKWRNYLLSFISSEKKLAKTLDTFNNDPTLGMVASYNIIMPFLNHGKYNKWVIAECQKLFQILKISPNPKKNFKYVAGTMFIARTEILKKIKELNFDINSFVKPDRSSEKDLAHVLEYFFGWLVTSTKVKENNLIESSNKDSYYKITDSFTNPLKYHLNIISFISKHHRLVKILRFILRREYISDQNKICISFFKIPLCKIKLKKN